MRRAHGPRAPSGIAGTVYPSVSFSLAVCVSLSSEAGDWLANLILKENNWSAFTPSAMAVFLARLLVERPYFQRSATFGVAILRLIDGYSSHDATKVLLGEFTGTDVAKVSIGLAFKLYEMSQHTTGDRVFCYRSSELGNEYGFITPYRLALPFDVVRGILEIGEPIVFSTWEGKSTVTTAEVLEELRAEATLREGGKEGRPLSAGEPKLKPSVLWTRRNETRKSCAPDRDRRPRLRRAP